MASSGESQNGVSTMTTNTQRMTGQQAPPISAEQREIWERLQTALNAKRGNISLGASFDTIFGVTHSRYAQGKQDCYEGLPAQSTDADYEAGYGAQYELEQIAGGLSNDS